jgi:hypothetical protein
MTSLIPWYDHIWVQSLAAVLLCLISVVSVVIIALQLRALNRKNEFDIELHLRQQFDRRFPGNLHSALYQLGVKLVSETQLPEQSATESHDPFARYEQNLVRRWIVVAHLPEPEYEKILSECVRPLVNHYSEIARFIEFGIVRSNRFLSTYHLAVIRDLYALEPFILHQSRRKEQARWGMRALALGEIAREYHLTNRLHGRAVFLLSRSNTTNVTYAPVLCGWRHGRPFLLRLKSALRLYGRLSERRKDRQEKRLDRLEARFAQEEKNSSPAWLRPVST